MDKILVDVYCNMMLITGALVDKKAFELEQAQDSHKYYTELYFKTLEDVNKEKTFTNKKDKIS